MIDKANILHAIIFKSSILDEWIIITLRTAH